MSQFLKLLVGLFECLFCKKFEFLDHLIDCLHYQSQV